MMIDILKAVINT